MKRAFNMTRKCIINIKKDKLNFLEITMHHFIVIPHNSLDQKIYRSEKGERRKNRKCHSKERNRKQEYVHQHYYT